MIEREPIYQALFALVTPLQAPHGPFKTVTREVIEVQRVPPLKQPVLMQDEAFEDFEWTGDLPKDTFTVYFHIGAATSKGDPGAAKLNPLIDAVIACFRPPLGEEEQNLGGLVKSVRVKGRAAKDSGDNSLSPDHRQGIYYLPVEIALPSSP
jgi:hypothetical protein